MKVIYLAFLACIIFLLSGCTSSEYKEAIAKGEEAITAGEYKNALEAYALAISEKETEEAKTLHKLLQVMGEAEKAFNESNFERSITKYEAVMETESNKEKLIEKIKKDAGQLLNQAQLANDTYSSMTENLIKGKAHLEAGQFEKAIELFDRVSDQSEFNISKIAEARDEAGKLGQQAMKEKETYAVYQKLQEQLEEGRALLKRQKFNEAISIFSEISSNENDAEHTKNESVIHEADNLLEDATSSKREYEEQKQREKEEQEKRLAKQKEEKQRKAKQQEKAQQEPEQQENPAKEMTPEDARELVLNYLQSTDGGNPLRNPNMHLDYSHQKENGDYVFQLYEVVIDNPETKEGHMATWGFYAIDPVNEYVYDNMIY